MMKKESKITLNNCEHELSYLVIELFYQAETITQ